MIIRKWKNSDIVTIKLTVATVHGYRPLVRFTEEIEKAWEKLKTRHRLKQQQQRPKKFLQKIASTNELHSLLTNINKYDDNEINPCPLSIIPITTTSITSAAADEEKNQLFHQHLTKKPQKSNTFSGGNSVFSKFREMEASGIQEKKDDVYDKNFVPKKFSKFSADYGTPKPGTLTEMRAAKASKHIAKEMNQICEIIQQYGKKRPDGKVIITFKQLFDLYTYISDKVVGILLRARKYNMLHFEGEMLFQKRDDAVIITLLLTPEEIKAAIAKVETSKFIANGESKM